MNLVRQIETIMKSDGMGSPAWLRKGLSAISFLYGNCVQLRTAAYNNNILKTKHLPCVVISIGNITVGGTGKTPLTIYMAEFIERMGYQVVILSRGYGGSAEGIGGIVDDQPCFVPLLLIHNSSGTRKKSEISGTIIHDSCVIEDTIIGDGQEIPAGTTCSGLRIPNP